MVNNFRYLRTFPDIWIQNNLPGSGPLECINCRNYGCIDNIFIGYCNNCSEHIYNFERGDGFGNYVSELILENIGPFNEYIDKEKFNIITYLENKKNYFKMNNFCQDNKTIIPINSINSINNNSQTLFWNCHYCQSINYSKNYYCSTCNQDNSFTTEYDITVSLNRISI